MRRIYDAVGQRLGALDFQALYPGFHAYPYALYDLTQVCLPDRTIPYQDAFCANTVIPWEEGKLLAIWQMDEASAQDLDVLAAHLVHEMFHAYQTEANLVAEWPDDLMLLCYPQDMTNYMIKHHENRLLADAVDAPAVERERLLQTLHACRALRRLQIGAFAAQEERVEQLEGQAECCFLLALAQLDADKYRKCLTEYQRLLREESAVFDVRRTSYYSGALLRLLESRPDQPLPVLAQRLQERQADTKRILRDFFRQKRRKHVVSACLCGYDPMNQLRMGDMLWAKRFVCLAIHGESVRIDGPVVLRMKPGSVREVAAYFR